MNYRPIDHFYCVDLLRGLSAVTVLLWHYKHFWLPPFGLPITFDPAIQPLYFLLWPAYEFGYFAVQFFWLISGFIFAHVYAGSQITAGEFALRRFSRLYPLHLTTLLVITGLQALSIAQVGRTQIVGNFDLEHFLFNLCFVTPKWGWDWSFNTPIWSVTVEEVIYIAFFLICGIIFQRRGVMPAILALGSLAVAMTAPKLMLFGLCGFYFFVGCLTYYVIARGLQRIVETALLLIGFTVAVFVLFQIPDALGNPIKFAAHVFAFAFVVMLAAIIDVSGVGRAALFQLRWLGNSTYSTYLWHLPMQVGILTLLSTYGIDRSFFASPLALFAWIAIVLAVGVASFRFFEFPVQSVMRKAWSRRDEE